MINKQSIWALALFSLILVLSVYYITIPNEITVSNQKEEKIVKVENSSDNSTIEALKLEKEEKNEKRSSELKNILTNNEKTSEEKNNAYEELKLLNVIKGKEEEIEIAIKDKYKLDNYIEINNDKIKVVVIKDEKDSKLATEIMDTVQSYFEEKKYITIRFDK